jgi:uncharacterized protein (TIGR02598 family)
MKSGILKSWNQAIIRGFSLVEVTMATSIMALAITSVLGLIPFGISNVRAAGEETAECHIYRLILGRLNLVSLSGDNRNDVLAAQFDGRKFYFDSEGIEVSESEARRGVWFYYIAQVNVHPLDVQLPALKGGANRPFLGDPFLRRVTLLIAPAVNPEVDLNQVSSVSLRKYSSLLMQGGI